MKHNIYCNNHLNENVLNKIRKTCIHAENKYAMLYVLCMFALAISLWSFLIDFLSFLIGTLFNFCNSYSYKLLQLNCISQLF